MLTLRRGSLRNMWNIKGDSRGTEKALLCESPGIWEPINFVSIKNTLIRNRKVKCIASLLIET